MPDWRPEIRRLLAGLLLEPAREAEIVEEMAQHLDDRYAELRAEGVPADQARAAAIAELRERDLLQRELRRVERTIKSEPVVTGSTRRTNMVADLWQDLRYGARMLRRNPGFTLTAVLSLALGIGANTAIFSLIDAVLLKMLPVERPTELYFINNVGLRGGGGAPPYPCVERFREHSPALSGIATFNFDQVKLEVDGQVEQVNGQLVSADYFSLLGVSTIIGRGFEPADNSVQGAGGPNGAVAVIGYRYWERRFGGRPEVIGKVVRFGSVPVTIVGVTPPNFYGLSPGSDVDINLPMLLGDAGLFGRDTWWFNAVTRLAPGATVEQARDQLDAVFQGFMDESGSLGGMRRDFFDHIDLKPAARGLDTLRNPYSKSLLILMGVVAAVLLIACANVANLLLARSATRRREFAVRLALGASRFRLMRQMLTESLLLVTIGGAIGLLLARWSSDVLIHFMSFRRRQLSLDVQLDTRLLLFTLGLSLLTGIIFSLIAVFRSTRVDPGEALKEGAATASANRSRLGFGKLLVVAQVSLSLVLLVGAGLFLRTLSNLKNFDAGFRTDGVLCMRIDASSRNYGRPQLNSFWDEALERVKSVPGLSSASLSTLSPLDGRDRGVIIEVPGFAGDPDHDLNVSVNQITPDFFAALGITLLQGRAFKDSDTSTAPRVALLNETAARFYFGDSNPVNTKIRFRRPATDPPYEIVGVVRDSRQSNLREAPPRLVYMPVQQSLDKLSRLTLSARTSGDPAALVNPIRDAIRAMGADLLVSDVVTLDQQVNQTLSIERLVSALSAVFGVLASLLACIGLYGVMSYDVARRTREIGIRVALGAQGSDVVRLVMRETLLMILFGLAIGLGVAVAASHLIASLLFGLSPNDPLTIGLAASILAAVALLAGYLPASRAARVEPMVALRHE